MNEFVKPSKIHIQSLHRDDLLYESQKINPGKINANKINQIGIYITNRLLRNYNQNIV